VRGVLSNWHPYRDWITCILEGVLLFEINGEEILVGKGPVLRIPSWKAHKATALEERSISTSSAPSARTG
jgi:quercetin dioxygenase-like cupin family protein